MRTVSIFFGLCLFLAKANLAYSIEPTTPLPSVKKPDCLQFPVHCAEVVNATYDSQGQLWLAYVKDGFIYLTPHKDNKNSDAKTSQWQVNQKREEIYAGKESRPKIQFNPLAPKDVYIAWTKKTGGKYNGDIRFTYSRDLGKTFNAVQTINNDGLITSHRFESMHVDQKGDVWLVWLDKRDKAIALHKAQSYHGSALYSAVSTDGGESFNNHKVADHACECCRTAIAPRDGDGAAVLWRHIFDEQIRDHAFTLLNKDKEGNTQSTPVTRIAKDNWHIEACPHHGPSLDYDGRYYHAVWFNGAEKNTGLHYGRINAKRPLAEQKKMFSLAGAHPSLAVQEKKPNKIIHIVWKEFIKGASHIRHIQSKDGGASWSAEQSLMSTQQGSDYPLLVAQDEKTTLLWLTEDEGLRVKAL